MKKFVALKNISFYGKLVLKDTVVEMEDAKAKIFLEKGFLKEMKEDNIEDDDGKSEVNIGESESSNTEEANSKKAKGKK